MINEEKLLEILKKEAIFDRITLTNGKTIYDVIEELRDDKSGATSISPERDKDVIVYISDLLRNLGMPTNGLGFKYVREAICLCVHDEDYVHSVTKILYPDIAKKFHSTSSRVERAMRHAIEVAFNRADPDIIKEYFGNSIDPIKGKPSNSEFISMLADFARTELS